MAEGWAEATQGVKWLGWCVALRAQAGGSVGRLQEGLVSTSFTRVGCHSECCSDGIGGCGPLFAGCQQRTRA
jgi:hypothetical protein